MPKKGIGRAILAFLVPFLLLVAADMLGFGLGQPLTSLIGWGIGLVLAYLAYQGRI